MKVSFAESRDIKWKRSTTPTRGRLMKMVVVVALDSFTTRAATDGPGDERVHRVRVLEVQSTQLLPLPPEKPSP